MIRTITFTRVNTQGATDTVAAFSIRSLCQTLLFIMSVLISATPVLGAGVNIDTRYVITLRNTNIANVSVQFEDIGDRYKIQIFGDVSGLAKFITSGTAHLISEGQSTPSGLVSEKFELKTITSESVFTAGFNAINQNATSFYVQPPLTINQGRVPIAAAHRQNINDPIASFLIKAPKLDKSVCDQSFEVFTGVERYDIKLTYADHQTATSKRTGYQGPVVLCKMNYNPIAGHFSTSDTTNYMKNNQRFLIWYAPLENSEYMIPYRVLVGTAFGDLSMVLTQIKR